MNSERTSIFNAGLRPSDETAIEESGLLGTRRGWANINKFEIIFLIVGVLATIATDGLTIVRLTEIHDSKDPDLAYAVLILINSIFLLLFLITGIFFQRITHIVAFFVCAVMMTVYVIVHYITRNKGTDIHGRDATLRLIRLILTIVFNVCFLPLAILVIRDYRRDEFSKRLFGAFPSARRPLKMYNIFDCIVRLNTMLSISTLILNLYNFNDFQTIDTIVLSIGVPITLLWLGTGIGMARLENRILVGIFYLLSLFQPGILVYSLYSAIKTAPSSTSLATTLSSTSVTETTNLQFADASAATSTAAPIVLVSVPDALYVCVAINGATHILSLILGVVCIRNFGKGLKERIFNNPLDKWFQMRWSKA